MVLRWAKWQEYDSDGKWQKYDGKNVACLRSMFQGWYSFNPEPLSQLSLSYSDHTRSSDCMLHVGPVRLPLFVPITPGGGSSASRSNAKHIAAPKRCSGPMTFP